MHPAATSSRHLATTSPRHPATTSFRHPTITSAGYPATASVCIPVHRWQRDTHELITPSRISSLGSKVLDEEIIKKQDSYA